GTASPRRTITSSPSRPWTRPAAGCPRKSWRKRRSSPTSGSPSTGRAKTRVSLSRSSRSSGCLPALAGDSRAALAEPGRQVGDLVQRHQVVEDQLELVRLQQFSHLLRRQRLQLLAVHALEAPDGVLLA